MSLLLSILIVVCAVGFGNDVLADGTSDSVSFRSVWDTGATVDVVGSGYEPNSTFTVTVNFNKPVSVDSSWNTNSISVNGSSVSFSVTVDANGSYSAGMNLSGEGFYEYGSSTAFLTCSGTSSTGSAPKAEPAAPKPDENKPAAPKPGENKPGENKPAGPKADENKPAGPKADENKPAGPKAEDKKADDKKAEEAKQAEQAAPAETKAADNQNNDQGQNNNGSSNNTSNNTTNNTTTTAPTANPTKAAATTAPTKASDNSSSSSSNSSSSASSSTSTATAAPTKSASSDAAATTAPKATATPSASDDKKATTETTAPTDAEVTEPTESTEPETTETTVAVENADKDEDDDGLAVVVDEGTTEEGDPTPTPTQPINVNGIISRHSRKKDGMSWWAFLLIILVIAIGVRLAVLKSQGVDNSELALEFIPLGALKNKFKREAAPAVEEKEEKPEVVNGYLKKSNTAAIRPVYSNAASGSASRVRGAVKETPKTEPTVKEPSPASSKVTTNKASSNPSRTSWNNEAFNHAQAMKELRAMQEAENSGASSTPPKK